MLPVLLKQSCRSPEMCCWQDAQLHACTSAVVLLCRPLPLYRVHLNLTMPGLLVAACLQASANAGSVTGMGGNTGASANAQASSGTMGGYGQTGSYAGANAGSNSGYGQTGSYAGANAGSNSG